MNNEINHIHESNKEGASGSRGKQSVSYRVNLQVSSYVKIPL
jgi:hypothetical protein